MPWVFEVTTDNRNNIVLTLPGQTPVVLHPAEASIYAEAIKSYLLPAAEVIVKRRNSKGQIRYQVRVYHKGESIHLGTFDKLGEARKAEREAQELLAATVAEKLGIEKERPVEEKMGDGPVTCGAFARRWLIQDCPRTSGPEFKSRPSRSITIASVRFKKSLVSTPFKRYLALKLSIGRWRIAITFHLWLPSSDMPGISAWSSVTRLPPSVSRARRGRKDTGPPHTSGPQ